MNRHSKSNKSLETKNSNKLSDQNKQKAIFIDRDGVVNVNRDDYVKTWDEFEFLPGVKDAIKMVNQSEWLLIIITNQSPIGRGMFTHQTLDQIHNQMLRELSDFGCHIDAIYYCPHHPNDGCDCRKPKPGSILLAAKNFNIDLSMSWMIGDSESDLEAGCAAGCQVMKVTKTRSLLDIVKQILSQE